MKAKWFGSARRICAKKRPWPNGFGIIWHPRPGCSWSETRRTAMMLSGNTRWASLLHPAVLVGSDQLRQVRSAHPFLIGTMAKPSGWLWVAYAAENQKERPYVHENLGHLCW